MSVFVRVKLAGEIYALPVENVLEVTDIGNIAPVPRAPKSVLGVRNLRGQVLPVFELSKVFGVESEHQPSRLLVTSSSNYTAGLAIEQVIDVGELPAITEEADSEFLTGATLVDGALVGVVDIAQLFSVLEGQP